ncbi:TetR/AcrR family transcriptional regulator [Rhodococcus opacus]|uniref:TetR family transcriptional regulator n=1 Tax=Rhodococcus opacus TaxID=37919 RepID=A0A076F0K4_RHOOP|nr:TetR/AcrR family transcriptional regulator [Rhodococcus opacus]AII10957.1 TetR family transcriptional regulator [Rhodococcus opacus]
MSSSKSEATRERILFAAAEVLSRKGFSATRLGEIAAAADLRTPAIYYYFPSRHELISEVMAVGQSRLREHVTNALAELSPDVTPMDRICAAAAAHLEVELELSHFSTAVTRNTGQLPDDIHTRLRDDSRAYSALWRELIENAHEAGQIDDLDRRAAIKLVMGALNWTPEWWNRSQGSLADLVATAQSLIRHGLGPVPTPAPV